MTLPRRQRFRGGDRVVYLGGSEIPQHEGATGTVKGKPQQGRTGYGHFVRFDEGGTELVSEERLRSEIGQHRLAAMKAQEEAPKVTSRGSVIHNWDDVPAFTSEAEESAFWGSHFLGEELLEEMGSDPDEDLLPPPRPRSGGSK